MVPIFCYHSIGPSPLSIPRDIFEEQLGSIKRAGLSTLTLSQLLTLRHADQLRAVVLTFDDCFMDVYENALPLLRDNGCAATFFPVPGYDGVTRWGSAVERRWSDVRTGTFTIPFSYMGERERHELVNHGMEIGAHTLTHANLDLIDPIQRDEEIVHSKAHLEKELGVVAKSFCYPRGRYTLEVMNAVQHAGFLLACTTKSGYFHPTCNAFELPRFPAVRDPEIFRSILEGKGGLLPLHRRIVKKAARLVRQGT